mgnify:CR=1 FL=1
MSNQISYETTKKHVDDASNLFSDDASDTLPQSGV